MIFFECPKCGKPLEASDELAGNTLGCQACGTICMVPVDVSCDDVGSTPDAATITMDELEALRREMRQGDPKP